LQVKECVRKFLFAVSNKLQHNESENKKALLNSAFLFMRY